MRFADLDGDGRLDLLATDMRQGLVLTARSGSARELTPIGKLQNPAHAQLADFDGNGSNDLLIADLGSFQAGNHTNGAVVWMRGLPGGKFAPLSLKAWPRVADVELTSGPARGEWPALVRCWCTPGVCQACAVIVRAHFAAAR